jgi:hypothetical protein
MSKCQYWFRRATGSRSALVIDQMKILYKQLQFEGESWDRHEEYRSNFSSLQFLPHRQNKKTRINKFSFQQFLFGPNGAERDAPVKMCVIQAWRKWKIIVGGIAIWRISNPRGGKQSRKCESGICVFWVFGVQIEFQMRDDVI